MVVQVVLDLLEHVDGREVHRDDAAHVEDPDLLRLERLVRGEELDFVLLADRAVDDADVDDGTAVPVEDGVEDERLERRIDAGLTPNANV